ncbi:MAG: class I SAM-dependent methyltransferase [Acidobacteriota bacterium]|nr:MAG: class I SAM-dependent methyltransferase [Acidobacteriota bacterium]
MDYDRKSLSEVGSHYDSITDGWRLILGNNFHFGYFERPEQDLDSATRNLIIELEKLGPVPPGSSVLDVGCGIGEPAQILHESLQCRVTGISISQRGIELARQMAHRKGLSGVLNFEVVDILNNRIPSDTYDIAWVMESSHLMPDKLHLTRELFRILKPDGKLLLCDMVRRRDLTAFDLIQRADQFAAIDRTFGKAKTESPTFYREALQSAGFGAIEFRDITEQAVPTLAAWRRNLEARRDEVIARLSEPRMRDYRDSCDHLEDLMQSGILGYGLFGAAKPLSA